MVTMIIYDVQGKVMATAYTYLHHVEQLKKGQELNLFQRELFGIMHLKNPTLLSIEPIDKGLKESNFYKLVLE